MKIENPNIDELAQTWGDELQVEPELETLPSATGAGNGVRHDFAAPHVMNVSELLALQVPSARNAN